jgi:hypothetical protein
MGVVSAVGFFLRAVLGDRAAIAAENLALRQQLAVLQVSAIRFLKAQADILRRKLGGNRGIPRPDDRARLLAIGQELDHNVADATGIVTPQPYCRWVEESRKGWRPEHRPPCY